MQTGGGHRTDMIAGAFRISVLAALPAFAPDSLILAGHTGQC